MQLRNAPDSELFAAGLGHQSAGGHFGRTKVRPVSYGGEKVAHGSG
jgi:hypothetical protein